jgi:hypothetical protein
LQIIPPTSSEPSFGSTYRVAQIEVFHSLHRGVDFHMIWSLLQISGKLNIYDNAWMMHVHIIKFMLTNCHYLYDLTKYYVLHWTIILLLLVASKDLRQVFLVPLPYHLMSELSIQW